jgi:choline-sulfatase
VNRAAHPPGAETAAAFREEVARRWNLTALHEAVLASQQRRHLVYASLRQGSHRGWDFQPLRDASRSYIRNDQELNDLERMARFPPLG